MKFLLEWIAFIQASFSAASQDIPCLKVSKVREVIMVSLFIWWGSCLISSSAQLWRSIECWNLICVSKQLLIWCSKAFIWSLVLLSLVWIMWPVESCANSYSLLSNTDTWHFMNICLTLGVTLLWVNHVIGLLCKLFSSSLTGFSFLQR